MIYTFIDTTLSMIPERIFKSFELEAIKYELVNLRSVIDNAEPSF